jgi:hypothetical protein
MRKRTAVGADSRPARSRAIARSTYTPSASARPATRPLKRRRLSPRLPRTPKVPPLPGLPRGAARPLPATRVAGFGSRSRGSALAWITSNLTTAARVRRKRRAAPPRRAIAGPRRSGVNVSGVSLRSVSSTAGRPGPSGLGMGFGFGSGDGGGLGAGCGGGCGSGAGPGQLPPGEPVTVVTSMSSTPTHSSCPAAFVVITRTCTSGWPFAAAGNVVRTGVTSAAAPGPVVASATYPPGAASKLPLAPTRYWMATGSCASALEASTSRNTSRTDTSARPRVSSDSTRCGALAVADP